MTDYAGDVTPEQAWAALQDNPDAVLVDVRTQPEWAFVGVPDLTAAAKQAAFISWQVYPEMARNANFEADVDALGVKKDAPIYFLCRTGGRSRAAAVAMTAHGYKACYNVSHGFEGDSDSSRHRGKENGWKAGKLPWVQQ